MDLPIAPLAYESSPAQPLFHDSIELMMVRGDYLGIEAISQRHAKAVGERNPFDTSLMETGSLPERGIHVLSDDKACIYESSDQPIGPVNV